jgi:hypothetical protein
MGFYNFTKVLLRYKIYVFLFISCKEGWMKL